MADSSERELIQELQRRFPTLVHVVGRFGQSEKVEQLPWFLAMIMSACIRGKPGACCFVLDKTPGTTALVAILLVLERLREEFPSLASDYARSAFAKGQHVKVKPSDFVYEYEGIWEGEADLFRLKVQDREEWRSFPISEVLRLEPTTRKRPKGTLTSYLGGLQTSILDRILGIKTYGNSSMLRNSVLLYMAQARFAAIAESVFLGRVNELRPTRLSSFMPWGTIGLRGEIQPRDSYQVIGEPLIAVTRVAQDLADASRSVEMASRVVLVDGARGIVSDLQAFDEIADQHRMVILASPDETDEVKLLRDRDCPVWRMSPSEVALGETSHTNRSRRSLVGRTVRMAETRERSVAIAVPCQSAEIEEIADALERAAALTGELEENSESQHLLAMLFGILLDVSECCFGADDETIQKMERAQDTLTRNRQWMPQDVFGEFQFAVDGFRRITSDSSALAEKSDALLGTLVESDGRWAIAARTPRAASQISGDLKGLGLEYPVFALQSMGSEASWDGLIVPAWPGRRRFTKLTNLDAADRVVILTYPFERRWLTLHQNREQNFLRSEHLSARARAEILGLAPDLLRESEPPDLPASKQPTASEPPMIDLERRLSRSRSSRFISVGPGDEARPARLVEFHGSCYAFLTHWSELHVINELLDDSARDGARLRTVNISDLQQDDFVLFRAGGDKEFIRLLAEDDLGIEEYARLRAISERWKPPLRRLGGTPTVVQRRLVEYGLYRTVQTVRGWVGNPDLIGPGDDGDLKIIAKATGDSQLSADMNDTVEAISRIRGAHIAAGSRLTQLILGEVQGSLSRFDEEPVLLEMDYGQAWVVQVQAIDSRQQDCPSDQVNRLLWADDLII
ncbi:MAG: DrmE family protein [Chloroflexi bacterium]|nr:DrmE family protein [Chloroflexota bacterium]MCY3959461.1 DrmE family protein [Chloroflexota bacterium]